MSKSWLYGNSKIKVELIFSLFISFILSMGLFFLLQSTGEGLLDNYYNKSSYIEDQKNQAINSFKKFVLDNKLSVRDYDQIANWVQNERYIGLYIYMDNALLFSSDGNEYSRGNEHLRINPALSEESLHDVHFVDVNAQVYLESYFEYKYYYIVSFIGIAISFLLFICTMLFFINRKTSYIATLEQEIKILEGGELEYQITCKGRDELSSLAHSINEMRKSFIERLDSEEKARLANSELVTAISHDLRTPLTALIGYLDIIEYKKYKTDDHLKQYIHNSREKAYQIKHLSDKLFEHFTVTNSSEDILELESFDGIQLLDQLMDDQLIILQNNGYVFEYTSCDTPFQLEVNLISIRRVFDNIFSNITKYADKSTPVVIQCYRHGHFVFVSITNQIDTNSREVHSTGIGMKASKQIIEQHQGKLTITSKDGVYSVLFSLPTVN